MGLSARTFHTENVRWAQFHMLVSSANQVALFPNAIQSNILLMVEGGGGELDLKPET